VTLGLAERRVCRVLGQPRFPQRYQRQQPDDEAPLTVVSPWVTGQGSLLTVSLGAVLTGVLFLWAYWLEGKDDTL